uniref:NADH-ubiquinone oxidoreductase chain 4 n=1 Tax=Myzostoma seymourcollegiorum TaxID=447489 RepID=A6MVM1_MYZSE|nr:NADH dehydrogenase subunit 4 [Myzostoma seymourcollegiorum]
MMKIFLPLLISILSFYNNFNFLKLSFCISLIFNVFFMNTLFNNLYTQVFLINKFLLIDGSSILLILLSMWIIIMMILGTKKISDKNNNWVMFMLMNMIMLLALYLCFSSKNLSMFYFFFEMTLIPITFMIMIWGYQPERLNASIFMLMYTVIASLPLSINIVMMKNNNMNISFMYFFNQIMVNSNFNTMINLFMFIALLVKLPMFFMHMWLPKAHLEAPVFGSMILAAILLKLGGFGMMRMMLILPMSNMFLYLCIISIWGAMIISLICCRMTDIKMLIAYSSVAHMGMLIMALFLNTPISLMAAFFMMIAHAFTSSALFFVANSMYTTSNSRMFILNKSMLMYNPSLTKWWFIIILMSMATPPSINLISEMLLVSSLIKYTVFIMLPLGFMLMLSVVYSMIMYVNTTHGQSLNMMNSLFFLYPIDYTIVLMHLIPVIIMPIMINYM